MLTAETNERLARVGPGTPGGELLRRYWLPLRPYAKLLSEPVMKVRLLGEDLVLFRTLKGRDRAHRRQVRPPLDGPAMGHTGRRRVALLVPRLALRR